MMATSTQDTTLAEFETVTSTDIKKSGWKRVVTRLKSAPGGAMAVTNHREPEVILMTYEQYQSLLSQAGKGGSRNEDVLDSLRQDFDRRMAALQSSDFGERAMSVMDQPIRTKGKYRVRDSY